MLDSRKGTSPIHPGPGAPLRSGGYSCMLISPSSSRMCSLSSSDSLCHRCAITATTKSAIRRVAAGGVGGRVGLRVSRKKSPGSTPSALARRGMKSASIFAAPVSYREMVGPATPTLRPSSAWLSRAASRSSRRRSPTFNPQCTLGRFSRWNVGCNLASTL